MAFLYALFIITCAFWLFLFVFTPKTIRHYVYLVGSHASNVEMHLRICMLQTWRLNTRIQITVIDNDPTTETINIIEHVNKQHPIQYFRPQDNEECQQMLCSLIKRREQNEQISIISI